MLRRLGGRFARFVIPGLVVGSVVLCAAPAIAGVPRGAARLRALDPGALLGGKSVVVTGAHNSAQGDAGGRDFLLALGADETLIGGGMNEQLGSYGTGDTIRAGGKGHQMLVAAGHGQRIVAGGRGHNLVYVSGSDVTVQLVSRGNEVVFDGGHDRLVCSPRARDSVIYRRSTDQISRSCRDRGNQIAPLSAWPRPEKAAGGSAHASALSFGGEGTNYQPYFQDCPTATDQATFKSCTIAFPPRTLTGLWANEYVPAYRCPGPPIIKHYYSFLEKTNYAPAGTTLPLGVEVRGLGPIGVSITGTNLSLYTEPSRNYMTLTGSLYSSATNWTLGSASYQVILHCVRP